MSWLPIRHAKITRRDKYSPENTVYTGLMITYPAFILLALFSVLGALGGAVYVKGLLTEKHRIIQVERAEKVAFQNKFHKLDAAHKTMLDTIIPPGAPKGAGMNKEAYIKAFGQRAQLHLDIALAIENQEYSRAVEVADTLLAKPNINAAMTRSVRLAKAKALLYGGQLDDASEVLEQALAEMPDALDLLRLKMELLLLQRDFAAAKPILNKLIEAQGHTPFLMFTRGNIERGLGEPEKAANIFRQVLTSTSAYLIRASLNNLALLYAEDLGDFDKSMHYLRMLGQLAPESYSARTTAAYVLLMQGRDKESELIANEAIATNPSAPDAQLVRLYLAEKRGDEEYAKQLRESLFLDPRVKNEYARLGEKIQLASEKARNTTE